MARSSKIKLKMADLSFPKRRKLENADIEANASLADLFNKYLGVGGTATAPPPALVSLMSTKIRQDLYKLQDLFDAVGFRTSIVQSPRLAVSVYKESCVLSSTTAAEPQRAQQQDYLLTMLGLHPDQEAREIYYESSHVQEQYILQQYVNRLRLVRRKAMQDEKVQAWVQEHTIAATTKNNGKCSSLSKIQQFMSLMRQADHKLRQEQLDHELERQKWYNCTLANALLQQFLSGHHDCVIKDVFYKTSHMAKYERLAFYLYDPEIDPVKPISNFIWLPDLARALQQQQQQLLLPPALHQQRGSSATIKDAKGTRAIVQDMMATFWSHLLRHGGYYASATMKEQLSPALERYFLSGLRQDPNIPLKLYVFVEFGLCDTTNNYWYLKEKRKSHTHVLKNILPHTETHISIRVNRSACICGV